MSFKYFRMRVSSIAANAGARVRFHQEANGRYLARCSGGVTIIGNSSNPCVPVTWGCGHSAYATL